MTVPRALPRSLSSALPGIHWSLAGEGPPLYFQTLEQLQPLRLLKTAEDANGNDDFTSFLRDIPAETESLFPIHDTDPEVRHFGLISLGLILLGHGYTDECHNLITPLSWPDDIHFAHGPSQYHAATPSTQAYASYVHSLVHRKEGFHHGEFGMMGFANANYWSSATARSAGVVSLPHQQLYERVQQLCHEYSSAQDNCKAVQGWCQENDMQMIKNNESRLFDSRALHQLCHNVLRQSQTSTAGDCDEAYLQKFAEQVVESEIRILLWQCLQKAGFGNIKEAEVLPWKDETQAPVAGDGRHNGSSHASDQILAQPLQQECLVGRVVNEEIALTATRKLSSAHMDIFRSEGSVVLRGVVTLNDPLSSVAGIACRLLESPACRLVKKESMTDTTDHNGDYTKLVEVALLDTDLAVADMLARRKGCSGDATGDDSTESTFTFEAVESDDPRRIFIDPLFGARGVTPTTVVQWSKGTIH